MLSTIVVATLGLSGDRFASRRELPVHEARIAGGALDVRSEIAKRLAGEKPRELRTDEWRLVARLYHGNGEEGSAAPLWLDDDRFLPRAHELARVIAAADSLGLERDDYASAAVQRDITAATNATSSTREALLAAADVRLTSSLVALLDDLLTGRVDPKTVERGWHIATNRSVAAERIRSSVAALRGGKSVGAVLAELRPDYGVYSALVQGLARYRAIAREGGWPRLGETRVLRRGDSSAAVTTLRTRLATEGYLESPLGSGSFDDRLAGALAEFQRRHGLAVDSAVGPRTRRALNVSAERRVEQIDANLERLRWLPANLGSRFVVVNIPAFSLYGYAGGARVLTMRVIVGDELVSRRTPIFADTMEYVEFGPYWNVPRSIAVNEILPKARRDRQYLARNGFQMLRGWGDDAPAVDPATLSDADLFSQRFRVRQLPGPNNALGHVKFIFPNDFNVYLHDTPGKLAFDEASRAQSHGCVRVADPQALAEFVLHDRGEWTPDRIRAALDGGRRVRVTLRTGVPVYLVYLTAFVRDGAVAFRDDIYDRDNGLIRALGRGARVPPALAKVVMTTILAGDTR
jgi:murein L,D-transpeptidase YcbB/YkuD